MSGLVNKVKEALHSDKHAETGTHNTATGTHNTATGTHNTATGTHSATTGYNDPEGVHGPHGSRGANAIDPRVDSDRDNRAAGVGNTGVGHTGVGHTGHSTATGTHSATTGYNDPEGVHGPHGSRGANAIDPRVDSDRDNRAAGVGHTGVGHTGHNTHTTGTTGYGAGTGAGVGAGGANVTGYNDPTGTHGAHNSRVANAADPRFDSDRDHRAAPGAAGTSHIGSGPGPAANTAGPHKQDLLNKADPRVDSDLDGSKTYGGNKTVSSGTTTGRDPTDAAQAPPSVLRQHVGEPSIEHGDHAHGRSERHASLSHQDAHRGI